MRAHGGSLPVTSSSTVESLRNDGMTPGGTFVSSSAAGTSQQVQLADTELAEVRVSME